MKFCRLHNHIGLAPPPYCGRQTASQLVCHAEPLKQLIQKLSTLASSTNNIRSTLLLDLLHPGGLQGGGLDLPDLLQLHHHLLHVRHSEAKHTENPLDPLQSNLWQSPIIVALKKEKYSTSDLSLHTSCRELSAGTLSCPPVSSVWGYGRKCFLTLEVLSDILLERMYIPPRIQPTIFVLTHPQVGQHVLFSCRNFLVKF